MIPFLFHKSICEAASNTKTKPQNENRKNLRKYFKTYNRLSSLWGNAKKTREYENPTSSIHYYLLTQKQSCVSNLLNYTNNIPTQFMSKGLKIRLSDQFLGKGEELCGYNSLLFCNNSFHNWAKNKKKYKP